MSCGAMARPDPEQGDDRQAAGQRRSAALHIPPVPDDAARIGILGGSFNPAHAGHEHISRYAIDLLQLDQVWWLVSPQNPLKSPEGMATIDERYQSCRDLLQQDDRIIPTDLEINLGTRKTAETLPKLQSLYPGRQFVWLMGADNLGQIHRWADWQDIFKTMPVAVFARPTYAAKALSSKAAQVFSDHRVEAGNAADLAGMGAPAWVYLDIEQHPASATDIRARKVSSSAP